MAKHVNYRRMTNQFNNLVSGKNLASVPQKMRMKYEEKNKTEEIANTLGREEKVANAFGLEIRDGIVKAHVGSWLDDFAQRLVQMYKNIEKPVKGEFNKGVTSAQLIKSFHDQQEKERAEYQASPEYKRNKELEKEKIKHMQQKCNEYVKELEILDFTDYEKVLDWLCKYQSSSDHIEIEKHKEEILKAFHDHGFKAKENIGKDFNENDEENFARYIIGQALSSILEFFSMHYLIADFTKQWKKKFNKKLV